MLCGLVNRLYRIRSRKEGYLNSFCFRASNLLFGNLPMLHWQFLLVYPCVIFQGGPFCLGLAVPKDSGKETYDIYFLLFFSFFFFYLRSHTGTWYTFGENVIPTIRFSYRYNTVQNVEVLLYLRTSFKSPPRARVCTQF